MSIREQVLSLHRDRSGLTLVEWILLAAVIVVPAVIVVLYFLNSEATRVSEKKNTAEQQSDQLEKTGEGMK
jgi:uncharacterized protein (UPF0333 family)